MTGDVIVFDRGTVRRHRDRAATTFGDADFLFREIGERLVDRLDDTTRRFEMALDLGCHAGLLATLAQGRRGISTLISADLSPRLAARAPAPALCLDEEALPFAPASLDLALSNLSLHWVNDLPGALVQIRRALKPDGLFLGALFGGDTLKELRGVLMEAELAETGGVSPRTSPVVDLRDAAGLLQRAGFALPVADTDRLTVTYSDMFALMRDLRAMGETNAVASRLKRPTRRAVLARAAALYAARHAGADGRITATFQAIFLTGWAPDASQPKAMRPGSAAASLAEALGGDASPPKPA